MQTIAPTQEKKNNTRRSTKRIKQIITNEIITHLQDKKYHCEEK
jgi:hypothetical protein